MLVGHLLDQRGKNGHGGGWIVADGSGADLLALAWPAIYVVGKFELALLVYVWKHWV